ncbi:folate transporter 1, chloroplastic isoform X4 [Magnolia sinica]|uniref:folate transporter 1, chloroplastic isoform X4 n=1 Tax=Magnolia sinica TaxID=86752 RepID=UPI0026581438|nr:folate transporter 1, chloroplastic isoform X4 [Magnolia sinica]
MPSFESGRWQWENAAAGAIAGFATVASLHPLDVVRTRFQVQDGRISTLPSYKNTGHAIFMIARTEGLRGLYSGFYPAVLGSTISWGLYFFFYSRAKHRYSEGSGKQLSPGLHLLSAAEAGALVCLFTNPIWLIKTRLQLQTPHHQNRPYSGFSDALRTIMKEEGWRALYKGVGPSLLLNSVDYAVLGASSKIAAILFTYPYQVIRARLQVYRRDDWISLISATCQVHDLLVLHAQLTFLSSSPDQRLPLIDGLQIPQKEKAYLICRFSLFRLQIYSAYVVMHVSSE